MALCVVGPVDGLGTGGAGAVTDRRQLALGGRPALVRHRDRDQKTGLRLAARALAGAVRSGRDGRG